MRSEGLLEILFTKYREKLIVYNSSVLIVKITYVPLWICKESVQHLRIAFIAAMTKEIEKGDLALTLQCVSEKAGPHKWCASYKFCFKEGSYNQKKK